MAAIVGTSGNDLIVEQVSGFDFIWGDIDGALLSGVGGNDRIFGRAFDDNIFGDATTIGPDARGGDDYISGGDRDDSIYGDARVALYGRGGNDTLLQDAGSGTMLGDAATLAAGSKGGNDRLFGGGGGNWPATALPSPARPAAMTGWTRLPPSPVPNCMVNPASRCSARALAAATR